MALLLLQVMSPMRKGPAGVNQLNISLQALLNPAAPHKAELPLWPASTSDNDATTVIRVGDRVIQNTNNYQKDVFNGDIGFVADIKKTERQVLVRFPGEVALLLPCLLHAGVDDVSVCGHSVQAVLREMLQTTGPVRLPGEASLLMAYQIHPWWCQRL